MADEGYIRLLEDVVSSAAAEMRVFHEELRYFLGRRPMGFTEGDLMDQLAAYLQIRNDSGAWLGHVQDRAARNGGNLAAAGFEVMDEAARLEQAIDRLGGEEAAHLAVLSRQVERSQSALRRAVKLYDSPPVEIAPPGQPYTPERWIAPLYGGDREA